MCSSYRDLVINITIISDCVKEDWNIQKQIKNNIPYYSLIGFNMAFQLIFIYELPIHTKVLAILSFLHAQIFF